MTMELLGIETGECINHIHKMAILRSENMNPINHNTEVPPQPLSDGDS